mmetsp:Transcript_34212/g.89973  ORF Transcript_34212/g.89973 Transcript_34212/m.89973 type:complete len:120 (-) Transcript_34212:151-510(-)
MGDTDHQLYSSGPTRAAPVPHTEQPSPMRLVMHLSLNASPSAKPFAGPVSAYSIQQQQHLITFFLFRSLCCRTSSSNAHDHLIVSAPAQAMHAPHYEAHCSERKRRLSVSRLYGMRLYG